MSVASGGTTVPDSDELARFREEWKAEVRRKTRKEPSAGHVEATPHAGPTADAAADATKGKAHDGEVAVGPSTSPRSPTRAFSGVAPSVSSFSICHHP